MRALGWLMPLIVAAPGCVRFGFRAREDGGAGGDRANTETASSDGAARDGNVNPVKDGPGDGAAKPDGTAKPDGARKPDGALLPDGVRKPDGAPKPDTATKFDTARKPDSLKPDSLKPDSLKPDSPRPDSPRPDSPKPDSPKPDSPKPDSLNPDAAPAGTLLCSEPFTYANPVGTSINGLNGGTGWGTNAWAAPLAASTTANLVAGLTFSDYPVAGKALQITDTNNNLAGTVAARKIGTGITPGATVWVSFLFARGTCTWEDWNQWIVLRKGTTQTGGTSQMDTAVRNGAPGVNYYDNGWSSIDGNDTTAAWNSTAAGVVYLIIGKITNVGGGGNQQEKLWVLSAANYDAIKAGGITEAELDATNTAHVNAVTVTGKVWNVGEYIQIATGHTTGGQEQFTLDEIKYGTALGQVL